MIPKRSDNVQARLAQPYRVGSITSHPGLNRVLVNTTHYKDALAARLRINPHDPGAWMLHSDTVGDLPGALIDYARQLCAEAKDDKGTWRQIANRPNHYLDCEVGQLLCADFLGVRYLEPPDRQPAAQEQDQSPITGSFSRW